MYLNFSINDEFDYFVLLYCTNCSFSFSFLFLFFPCFLLSRMHLCNLYKLLYCLNTVLLSVHCHCHYQMVRIWITRIDWISQRENQSQFVTTLSNERAHRDPSSNGPRQAMISWRHPIIAPFEDWSLCCGAGSDGQGSWNGRPTGAVSDWSPSLTQRSDVFALLSQVSWNLLKKGFVWVSRLIKTSNNVGRSDQTFHWSN